MPDAGLFPDVTAYIHASKDVIDVLRGVTAAPIKSDGRFSPGGL
jgi:hypothetical protein